MQYDHGQLGPASPFRLGQVVANFRPQRYPRVTAILLLWLAGLFFMFLAPAPRRVTPAMQKQFDLAVKQVVLT